MFKKLRFVLFIALISTQLGYAQSSRDVSQTKFSLYTGVNFDTFNQEAGYQFGSFFGIGTFLNFGYQFTLFPTIAPLKQAKANFHEVSAQLKFWQVDKGNTYLTGIVGVNRFKSQSSLAYENPELQNDWERYDGIHIGAGYYTRFHDHLGFLAEAKYYPEAVTVITNFSITCNLSSVSKRGGNQKRGLFK